MTDPAAFRATYSDFKLIRGRKVVQLVFEVPIEESNKAYEVLGGMPNPAAEVWCAIARLSMEVPAEPPPHSLDPDKEGARRLYARVGLMCRDPQFRKYLEDFFGQEFTEEDATKHLRAHCGVKSRKEIVPESESAVAFEELYNDFQAWNVPEDLARRG